MPGYHLNLTRLRVARLVPAVLVIALGPGANAADPCPATVTIQAGDTLESLAAKHLGTPKAAIAIALATNARTAQGFRYIANPDDISQVPKVCIPTRPEARSLQKSWDSYDRAVAEGRLPRASALGKNLVAIDPAQPVDVVAWVRQDQADRMKAPTGGWITAAAAETWVTVEPHLRDFCTAFVRDRKPNPDQLTARLEQRLGLSPSSSKTRFVRIRLEHPDAAAIFRPCMNSAADRAECPLGPPSGAPPSHQQWLFQQYYSSYGQSLISEFPWTALGYTFDWAPGKASRFERYGESEFVIHTGAAIQIQEALETDQYCGPGASR